MSQWRGDLVAEALDQLNIDRTEDTSTYPRIVEIMNALAEAVKPPGTAPRRRSRSTPPPTLTARKKRHAAYSMIQTAYRKDRKRCVQTILNGHWQYDTMTAQPKGSWEAGEHPAGP